jgi:hypothetical protein
MGVGQRSFGRSEARYKLSPSGDSIGQPSRNGVLISELLPAISSSFRAGSQAEKCGAAAAVAASDATKAVTATTTAALHQKPSVLRIPTAPHLAVSTFTYSRLRCAQSRIDSSVSRASEYVPSAYMTAASSGWALDTQPEKGSHI